MILDSMKLWRFGIGVFFRFWTFCNIWRFCSIGRFVALGVLLHWAFCFGRFFYWAFSCRFVIGYFVPTPVRDLNDRPIIELFIPKLLSELRKNITLILIFQYFRVWHNLCCLRAVSLPNLNHYSLKK